ncbi:cytochrome P450 [Xylariales sp. PMI_506]|nr:cytochrome P450 [Xylariales sp. PMI_506]
MESAEPFHGGLSQSLLAITAVIGVITFVSMTIFKAIKSSDNDAPRKLLKFPVIGDLHKSPIDKPLLNWDGWVRQHGPLATTRLFGIMPMVVINTSEVATELLSRRSQWYSNRPPAVTMEMITDAQPGKSKFTLLHDYDSQLKLHHRLLSQSLGAIAAPKYQPLIELETHQLLKDIMELATQNGGSATTTNIYIPLERAQSSAILALHYGLRIPGCDAPILHEIIRIQQRVTYLAANPGLPDLIPPLRHLPAALSPWKRSADEIYHTQLELYTRLYNHGKSAPGWNATKQAHSAAEKYGDSDRGGDFDTDLAFSLATSVQGGMETSPRQLLWLFVAGLAYPGWWTRAQAVIDAAVGRARLPQFTDRAALAYADAVAHEVVRWRPIAPAGIPRRADRDDRLGDVKISKGTTVLTNAWGLGRDAAVFDPALGDVHDFVPERWLVGGKDCDGEGKEKLRTDLPQPAFGYGRRMCLGKKFATDSLFLQVARILWAFNLEPIDEVDPWSMEVVGFMTAPKAFEFRLTPRGPWVSEVIAREWQALESGLSDLPTSTLEIKV